jgi:acetyl-CoA acetyltransferase
MPEAVILSALRTPVGTAYKGTLRDTTAFDLADHVVRAAADGLDPERVDDVILAEGLAGGGVIARHAAITAGLQNVPGLALNRHCAASLSAVATAAGSIRSGMDELIIAGGVSSGSTAPRVACVRILEIDPEKVNVNGSGCSLGHPIAATGGRMLSTLVHQLRRQGGGIGVAAMCAGGGMGGATVIEVLAP